MKHAGMTGKSLTQIQTILAKKQNFFFDGIAFRHTLYITEHAVKCNA